MANEIYSGNFSKVLNSLLRESGITGYRICQFTGIDPAYLSRLIRGKKNNPSVEVIFKICLALVSLSDRMTIQDIERLFNSLGRTINLR
jgi:transcriptional regulator with XRE-family HTH domain